MNATTQNHEGHLSELFQDSSRLALDIDSDCDIPYTSECRSQPVGLKGSVDNRKFHVILSSTGENLR